VDTEPYEDRGVAKNRKRKRGIKLLFPDPKERDRGPRFCRKPFSQARFGSRTRGRGEEQMHFGKHAAGAQARRSTGLERGGNGRTYLWALQSRSIRMSSSEESAAARPAAARADAEHIPRPHARAAAASPAPRLASAVAMAARPPRPPRSVAQSLVCRFAAPHQAGELGRPAKLKRRRGGCLLCWEALGPTRAHAT
jgi:hypothetical protein